MKPLTDKESLVFTNENCVGCNKCIKVCSCVGACISTEPDERGVSRINVDPKRCVACGACFDACDHNARSWRDDTDAFFADLQKGDSISVLIAPAFKANYPDEYEQVLGGLKKLGVKRFINVSFGADITTWGYINYIRQYGFTGGISQPCPAVVAYIEKYHPELLPKLFPVQSPLMCAAIYARKEMGITDKFAFISPCIAKKMEIEDPHNKGLVQYNVTFEHLMQYVRSHQIEGEPVTDEIGYGLGAYYPTPGGLMENVRWLVGDEAFIREISGEKRMYRYLDKNAKLIADGETPFLMIDALNCEKGCICGTAVDLSMASTDKALYNLLKIRESVKNNNKNDAWGRSLSAQERMDALNKQFASLRLDDYLREYTDRSAACHVREPLEEDMEKIFNSMRKFTEESRNINCTSCGYDTCRQMAKAIYNGFNHRENCIYYLKREVEDEKELLNYETTHDADLRIWRRRLAVPLLSKIMRNSTDWSVVMADIDGFRNVNSTYGTQIADKVLLTLTERLKTISGKWRMELIRYAGDEFLFLMPDLVAKSDHPAVLEILKAFSDPIILDNIFLKLSASVGIALPVDNLEAEHLIANAEDAMDEARRRGKNQVYVYSKELKDRAHEEHTISEKLIDAIENDKFYMLYQPKVDVKTKLVNGYEALVRMKDSKIGPAQFIPVAEKNGWIWRIGRITTELTIRQMAVWRGLGYPLQPVSINYSSRQISDSEYVSFLEEMLQRYNIPSNLVEIEITESVFLDRTVHAELLLDRFRKAGIRLVMDDFGIGYSALGYLTYIPVETIKLDKSLVNNYLVQGNDSIIKDVINLSHDLGKGMVVEGVETGWQYERLKEFGADTIQGYYFSKPLEPKEAIAFQNANS